MSLASWSVTLDEAVIKSFLGVITFVSGQLRSSLRLAPEALPDRVSLAPVGEFFAPSDNPFHSMKSMSREVTIPRSLPPSWPFSVIGIPPNPFSDLTRNTSWTVLFGPRTTGSRMNPCLYFFTLRTSAAWKSGVQLWWMIPIPPHSCNQVVISGQSQGFVTHSHGNGHFGFSNCVHRRRNKRRLKSNLFS